ncbi:MAG: hypothetical protein RIB67_03465 [Miltoncostaeaceae bacterium]
MPLHSRTAGALAAALMVSGAIIAAGASAAPTVVNDRAGDNRFLAGGPGDIRRVITTSTRTYFRVRVVHGAPTEARSVFVNLRVGNALYQVRRGSLYRVRTFDVEGGPARRVGPAPARASGRLVTVTVPRRPLGTARLIRVQAMVLQGLDPVDLAPDRGLARHVAPPARSVRPDVPRLRAPSSVIPGRPFRLVLSGFAPRTRVTILLTPSEFRGGNGRGISLRRIFRTDARGVAVLRPTWPARFAACAGATDCTTRPWTRGQRVDINACTVTGGTCRRAVTRIR